LHRLPESIITDRGVQFAVEMMRELNCMLGIDTKLSMTYHPQTDGQTKRMNQDLEQYLRMFIDYQQEQWPDWLATANLHITIKYRLVQRYHHSRQITDRTCAWDLR